MNWSVAQVQPWIDTVLELFSPARMMCGSHRAISRLATDFPMPHVGYEKLVASLSPTEQDAIFRRNAKEWFF
jgi:predicted TIM-barrel fold metal-dependent hydrolase